MAFGTQTPRVELVSTGPGTAQGYLPVRTVQNLIPGQVGWLRKGDGTLLRKVVVSDIVASTVGLRFAAVVGGGRSDISAYTTGSLLLFDAQEVEPADAPVVGGAGQVNVGQSGTLAQFEVTSADPRTAGLAREIGSTVVTLSGGAVVSVYQKVGSADTAWQSVGAASRTQKIFDGAAGAAAAYDITVSYSPDFVWGEFWLPIDVSTSALYVRPNGSTSNTTAQGFFVYDPTSTLAFQETNVGFQIASPGEATKDVIAGRFWLDAMVGFPRRCFIDGMAVDVGLPEVLRSQYTRGLWNDPTTPLATVRIVPNAATFPGGGWIKAFAGWW